MSTQSAAVMLIAASAATVIIVKQRPRSEPKRYTTINAAAVMTCSRTHRGCKSQPRVKTQRRQTELFHAVWNCESLRLVFAYEIWKRYKLRLRYTGLNVDNFKGARVGLRIVQAVSSK